ncbi:MAG: formate C-acetyltransferase/glycerol dehydratase family glycyl radical enzyme, partial [Spirochaetes bacterium]|nr:formate C-acetyltransferase/glycerol dehydratase family glycyl radical enzyme [Spirochaetota bacterium]
RAVLVTNCYKANEGKVSVPVLRALAFKELCEKKAIYLGDDELIVGERGPAPKAVSTYPELTCHSEEDLQILRSRPMTRYAVSDETITCYREQLIPYWRGRSIRDRAFAGLPEEWQTLYQAGLFTEFMEQRAPGHTAMDGLLYRCGLRELKEQARQSLAGAGSQAQRDELEAMIISCDAAISFAQRHAELAESKAATETRPERKQELAKIAEVCRRVPAEAPRDFHEAVQAYWFVHLGTITELNGWDAMSPGHFDQHLAPFYSAGLAAGTLTREQAKELLSAFWIKVNNTPAPPKVGVTAAESGTYNDFTNINMGGLLADGLDGSSEVSLIMLELLNELRLLQPQANLQVSSRMPDHVLEAACRVAREGAGYPSFFNADEVVLSQTAMGKTLADAREGGTSGCVETGCFGKEAYLLHGYLNGPKLLLLALNDGRDPASGQQLGPHSGELAALTSFESVYRAWEQQLAYVVDWKVRVDNTLAAYYGELTPAPFLSLYIADCIKNGKDYYCGGARYNTDYIQCVGLGTLADSFSVIRTQVFGSGNVTLQGLLTCLQADWQGKEGQWLQAMAHNKTARFGNDDDNADQLARRVFDSFISAIEGRTSWRGGIYHADFLSTTCHVYFGKKTAATPDGRQAGTPLSDGTSPAHGADRKGPTAVMNSLGKLDQARSGGTLLNQRFSPGALSGDEGPRKLASLIRGYFKQGGHHAQFNVVDEATLRAAKARPEDYRNLLVRVAGYSDYFVDLDEAHQNEIIARTAHE